ncbi:MAG TPA: glycosyltransferase family 4 protein [Anaerolineae bacterium]|nr:glycosyltransferase family 4 protein [Anaerolineae bacterium]HQI83147.1 glycosyltransferase family 4 protein [Anaerolineae bacterium]
MRIVYALLSPTFGMHQYTADIANRAAAYHEVHLVTTSRYPAHRYAPAVTVHTPIHTTDTGFSHRALNPAAIRHSLFAIRHLSPDVVHFGGPHLWNVPLILGLRRAGIPVIHTLHDLDPHPGSAYGPLLYLWNRQVLRTADHILIHAVRYQERLLAQGIPAARLTCTPLLHLFLGHTFLDDVAHLADGVTYAPEVLFFGRLERYKGVAHLLTAWAMVNPAATAEAATLVLAGPGDLNRLWSGPLPPGVELRNRLIDDKEALALFKRCSLLVLPYMGGTQSALIPAAYFFHKPVLASPSGALDEYVEDGVTGWVVEPEHPASLARCLTAALADLTTLVRMGDAGHAWYEDRRQAEEQTLLRMYERVNAKT